MIRLFANDDIPYECFKLEIEDMHYFIAPAYHSKIDYHSCWSVSGHFLTVEIISS